MIYHTIFEIRYSHSKYPSEKRIFSLAKEYTFSYSWRYLASGAKSYVCCVNPTNSALWFEAPITI